MALRISVGAVLIFLCTSAANAQNPGFDDLLMRGDANNDSQVTSADSEYIGDYLFSGGTTLTCLDAADVNDDGQINISDMSYLNTFLFRGGPAPPAPFPGCGADPTSDALSCNSTNC